MQQQERQGRGRAVESHWRDRRLNPDYYRTEDSPPHIPMRGLITGTATGLALWLVAILGLFVLYAVF